MLYLNKMLLFIQKITFSCIFFYKLDNKTLIHLFSSCNQVILLWTEIKLFFSECTQLSFLSPKIAFFGLVKGNNKFFLIQNMILLVFKLYVYKSRVSGTLNFNIFLHKLIKVQNSEKGAAFNFQQKHG